MPKIAGLATLIGRKLRKLVIKRHYPFFVEAEQYFSESYYLERNPDVANAGVDPFLHFLEYGQYENRNPNAFLDLHFYAQHMIPLYPVNESITSFIHYLKYGSVLDLWPCAMFDPVYYRGKYEVRCSGPIINSLEHFLTTGVRRGFFSTHPVFADLGV